jgi:hypothetical protein
MIQPETRFPTPTGVEPWWDIFLPATFGEIGVVLEAMERLHPDGDGLAVGARALYVLGRGKEADRFVEKAIEAGGEEAEALATLLRPQGIERARLRMLRCGRAGERADAACDLALLQLQRGDAIAAGAAVEEARTLCPDHTEAARWRRFLREAEDPLALVKEGMRGGGRLAGTPCGRDAVELVPVRMSGWISPERLRARVLGGVPRELRAPAGCALGRLQDAGRHAFVFAMPGEHARLPADHPLATLEVVADELMARVGEGRPARDDARGLWEAAVAVDDVAADDAAHLLAGLATVDLALAPLAHHVADRMVARATPRERTLWTAYRAWHGWAAGRPRAPEDARDVLAVAGVDPFAWTLANAALRFAGFGPEAALEARRALRNPDLREAARKALDEPTAAPRAQVSGRLVPRGLDPAN